MFFRRTLWRISSIKIIQKLKFKRFISCILVCILQVIMVDSVQMRSRESSFSSWGFAKLLACVCFICVWIYVYVDLMIELWFLLWGRWQILVIQAFSMLELEPDLEALEAEGSWNWNKGKCYDRRWALSMTICSASYMNPTLVLLVGCQEQLLFVVLFTGTALSC